MTKIIYDQKDRVNRWAYSKVGRESPFTNFYAIGIERNGRLIGGVVFDGFASETRCSLHAVGIEKNWCTKALLKSVFDYAFNFAKCKVIINTVSSSNEKSIKFTEHIGFTKMCTIKNGAPDGDLVVLALNKEDCKWL